MQIKIFNNVFECLDVSAQLSLGSHATLTVSFDLGICKCKEFFIKIFETKSKFEIESTKFLCKGCYIKAMDIEPSNKMSLLVHSDLINPVDLSIRREDFLNDILTKTFDKPHDIN